MSESDNILNTFPKELREEAPKWIKELNNINPQSDKGKKKITEWMNVIASRLDGVEGVEKEKVLQKIVATVIAHLEASGNKEKDSIRDYLSLEGVFP